MKIAGAITLQNYEPELMAQDAFISGSLLAALSAVFG
jgi:hypothetical protein